MDPDILPTVSVRYVRHGRQYLTQALGTLGATLKTYPGIGIPYPTYPWNFELQVVPGD